MFDRMLRASPLRPSRAKPAPPRMLRASPLRPSRAKPAPPRMLRASPLRPSRAKPAPPRLSPRAARLIVELVHRQDRLWYAEHKAEIDEQVYAPLRARLDAAR